MQKKTLLGITSLLGATFLYGFFGILTRLVGFKYPIFYLSFIRSTIATLLIILIFKLFKSQWVKIEKKDYLWIMLRTAAGMVSFCGSYIAMYYIPISTTYFIHYFAMLIASYFIGYLFFKEKINLIKIISVISAIIGLSLIYSFDVKGVKMIYVLCAFASGLGTAIWFIFAKKIPDKYSALQLNFLDNFFCIFIYCFLSLVIRESWIVPVFDKEMLGMLLFVLMFLLTSQLTVIGYRHLEVHLASLLMLFEILFGIILAYLFFNEIISFSALLGGGLIIGAIVLPQIKLKKSHVLS